MAVRLALWRNGKEDVGAPSMDVEVEGKEVQTAAAPTAMAIANRMLCDHLATPREAKQADAHAQRQQQMNALSVQFAITLLSTASDIHKLCI